MEKAFVQSLLLFGAMLWVCASFADEHQDIAKPEIKADNPVILLPEKADSIKKFAAEELKKHLELITGEKIEIIEKSKKLSEKVFPIYVGIPSPEDKSELKREEARYRISPSGIYIYGEDTPDTALFDVKTTRTGTLFAVYFFLENELGVRWIEPGDSGIAYSTQSELLFAAKAFSWVPQLKRRFMAFYSGDWKTAANGDAANYLPNEIAYSKEDAEKKVLEVNTWLKRMRMGSSFNIKTGHNIGWWSKYGQSNPEFFALFEGKRAPNLKKGARATEDIHICGSNRELHKRLVADWLEAWKKDPVANETINLCENDGIDYCTCPECVNLDVRKEGEPFGAHMTDRYIWFANEVLKLARKEVPDVKVTMYAYVDYLFPPRREKVSDGVIIAIVPTCLTEIKKLDEYYKSWRAAGAKEIVLRPNDLYINPGLPIGLERKEFDAFKSGINNNVIGTMYDRMREFWEISGIETYIMAKAFVYPENGFDFWEDEYCATFGPAKDDMKKYFSYWRENCRKNIWDEKEYPEKGKIEFSVSAGSPQFLWKRVNEYFTALDFDNTDSLLENASKKSLSENERNRLNKIKLANKHSRLVISTLSALSDKKLTLMEKIGASKKLLTFRVENKEKLNFCWPELFRTEMWFNPPPTRFARVFDNKNAGNFKMLETSVDKTYLDWNFKIDPENRGLIENWQNSNWDEISKNWVSVKTKGLWFAHPGMPEDLSKKLRGYIGIGWYASKIKISKNLKGKEIYLIFGELNESCQVYVNGKMAGEHILKTTSAYLYSFSIRIDQCFNDSEWQIVTVRVTNTTGDGGICQPVWLAVER